MSCSCCSVERQIIGEEPVRNRQGEVRVSADACHRIDEVYQLDLGKDGILGHSSIGFVVKTCHRKSRTIRAVKQISKRSIEGLGWKEEIKTISELDHPHICKLHETWEDTMHVYLIMELCKGGNLTKLSANQSQINENTIAALVWQMASAVSALHENKVCHSDVRLENWLFSEPVVASSPWNIMSLKMIDFGIANKFRHGRTRRHSREFEAREVLTGLRGLTSVDAKKRLNLTTERTLFCKSPEQLGFGTGDTNEMKVDVWALGVISYFLLSGQPPFQSAQGSTDAALFRSATFVFMPPELWRPISSEAKNFIAMCLQKDPEHRPDASKVMHLPWMVTARRAIDEIHSSSSGSDHQKNGHSMALVSSPTTGAGVGLGVQESILPSAKRTAKNLDRMSRLHVLEKAAIIAAAHRLSPPKLEEFKGALQSRDKTGSISVYHLFEELEAIGVPCADLSKLVKDLDVGGTVTIEYDVFCSDVAEFQQNLQDSAVWAVFRNFETSGATPHMTKKELTVVLGEDTLRQGIADNFPELALDSVLQELDHDAQGVIDFEEFKTILRTPAKSSNGISRTVSDQQYSHTREPTF